MNKTGDLFKNLLGFKHNSKYVKSYLNDANIKSSIYMSFIVLVIETWMILRRFYLAKYIPNNWDSVSNKFELIFKYTGQYALFSVCAITVFLFSLFIANKKNNRGTLIANLITGSVCVLWGSLIVFEILFKNITYGNFYYVATIMIYATVSLLGIFVISHALYQWKTNKKNIVLSNAIIICFALICLLFGLSVGYLDFNKGYMITCFLTMILFVACLLIWKPYISIIILTSIFVLFYLMQRNFDVSMLSANEVNYITFFISLTMVTISIYQQRVTEAKKDEQLIHDAIYDHSIEIHNVRYIIDKIKEDRANDLAKLQNKIYLFFNLVNFKTINVQRSFDEGDKFLDLFAKKLIQEFNGDYVARQSDDKFVVLTDDNTFMNKINELSDYVKELADGLFILLKVGGYKLQINETPYRAIGKAKIACGLISLKHDTIYNEYDDEMNEKFIKQQYIINHLDEALEKGWVRAYFQPVVWSDTHDLCGAEALARWIDPIYGFLSPADFIPVLEDTRLIHKLDKYIIEYVCKYLRQEIDEGKPIVPISINFSRLDFELMNVLDSLNEYQQKYNIDKKYIHVEITESALSDNIDNLNIQINDIKNAGYAIWLDDFGSGYSSLNVLKDFMFDVVKIDMKFLSNFEKNERTKDILDCIIQLATRLGMKTLTEGVETKEEADFLQAIGCGRLQGYLFGKPYKVEDFQQKILEKELKLSDHIL